MFLLSGSEDNTRVIVSAACYADRSLDRRVCDTFFFLSPLIAWRDELVAHAADVFIVTLIVVVTIDIVTVTIDIVVIIVPGSSTNVVYRADDRNDEHDDMMH